MDMAFAVLFSLGCYLAITILLPKVCGWEALCEKYPLRSEFKGVWLNFQTMKFGPMMHFKSCVSVGFTPEFMYCKLWCWPFAKQMQIPWDRITQIREQKVVFYSNVEFVQAGGEPITFLYRNGLRSYIEREIPTLGLTRLLENRSVSSH